MDIEQLIDIILTRNQIAIDEDTHLKSYINDIFADYRDKNTANTVYSIAINPKFKYWVSSYSDEHKLIWHPVFKNFNGVYEISKSTLEKSVESLVHNYKWGHSVDMKNLTPLEWFAVKTTLKYSNAYTYRLNFSVKCSDMFYRYQGDKRDDLQTRFEKTLVATLELSLKIFKPDDYIKFEF